MIDCGKSLGLGCSRKFFIILRQLHEGQQGQAKHSGSLSGSFPISNGVEQGCILASILLSIFFSMMARAAKQDLSDGIYIRFRKDAGLSSLRRLLKETKTTAELVTN